MKILVSRTDKAGDFILTLPIFRELKKAFPDSCLVAHIRKYTAPIAKLCKEIDEIILDDDFESGLFNNSLYNAFKEKNFSKAIIVHPVGRSILAAWRAKIPRRTGRASNIFQFLLNDGRIQKRSHNKRHEYEYNLDLLEGIVCEINYEPYHLDLSQSLIEEGKDILKKLGVVSAPIVIHPGHGGSAYNITPQMYGKIALELINSCKDVVVSMGPEEEKMEEYFSDLKKSGKIFFLKKLSGMDRLAGVFANCQAFVGGSTGPLHLAASLGLPCLAFYPPVKAMTPKRWGPVGCKSLVIKPDLPDCNGKCKRCKDKGCMESINLSFGINWLEKEIN